MLYKKIIPFSQIEKIECIKANGKVEDIASVYRRTGADIVINAPIFEFGSGEILSRFICNGNKYGTKQASTFGFSFVPEPKWNWDNGLKAKNYCAPYSYAVIDGIVKDGLNDRSKRGRTAIGITKNNQMIIYMVSDNDKMKCTSAVLCQRLIDMGCKYAINLDGGGSSQVYSKEAKYNSGRKVAGYIGIWLKKDIKESEEEKVRAISTKRQNVYLANGVIESGRYIDKNDVCEINGVAQNLLIKITYPAGNSTRNAYIKSLEGFMQG